MSSPGRVAVPTDCWFALGLASSIGRSLAAHRIAGRPVVAYRTSDGRAVALEDRCAHRPYPLSAGMLDGDLLRCGLCGFAYDVDGRCVSVPSQERVPFGAQVRSYEIREADGIAWAWIGEPGRARLYRLPELPWLVATGWATVSGAADVAAGFLLLHESFADVTQVPFVAPDISPGALVGEPPPLEVTVSETSVSLRREFAPAPLPSWQAELAGCAPDEVHPTVHEGFLLSPAVWVDHWDVDAADGRRWRLRFTHAVTPVDESSSRLLWAVSRDFAVDDPGATGRLGAMFGGYYARVLLAMERSQRVVDTDGQGREVNVSADVAALKVREIIQSLLADEAGLAG